MVSIMMNYGFYAYDTVTNTVWEENWVCFLPISKFQKTNPFQIFSMLLIFDEIFALHTKNFFNMTHILSIGKFNPINWLKVKTNLILGHFVCDDQGAETKIGEH